MLVGSAARRIEDFAEPPKDDCLEVIGRWFRPIFSGTVPIVAPNLKALTCNQQQKAEPFAQQFTLCAQVARGSWFLGVTRHAPRVFSPKTLAIMDRARAQSLR